MLVGIDDVQKRGTVSCLLKFKLQLPTTLLAKRARKKRKEGEEDTLRVPVLSDRMVGVVVRAYVDENVSRWSQREKP